MPGWWKEEMSFRIGLYLHGMFVYDQSFSNYNLKLPGLVEVQGLVNNQALVRSLFYRKLPIYVYLVCFVKFPTLALTAVCRCCIVL